MKRIIFILIVFVSVQSFAQTKKYFERLNPNGTIDSGYVKIPGDSVFNYNGDAYICRTKEFYDKAFNPEIPNGFSNFHQDADGVYRNYTPRAEAVDWAGVNNNPITTVGNNFYTLANPASPSLPRINSNGTVVTRTISEAQQDLGIDLKANINSPAFTGTPTGIGIPVYARVTGSNATTTGQALVDIAGLSIPLATNAIYEISGMLSVSTSNVTTGVQYGLNYSVAGGTVEAQLSGSLTSTATKTERISTLNAASTAYLTTSNGTGGIIIRGIITTGANAGNLTVKFLKVTSGTATVFTNSVLKVTRIQ